MNNYAHISILPPEGVGIRAPCDICCVVDTSGSMSTEVEIQGANDKEKFGLSQLDLVKHALKTIVHSLTRNDRLSIVSFANSASILFRLRSMDDDGRSSALAALERLEDNGQTNLWDGLKTGLEVLAEGKRISGSNVALFLLTDGCPNVEPPRGHLPTLAAYKEKSNFTCSINTFGFGYNLDSQLIEDLAQMGNSGSYAFIPDGSFVGTIFVNAISNLLTTAATNLQLSVGGIRPALDPSSSSICHYSVEASNQKVRIELLS
jgi:Mg-chelatase subunit ChlD